MTRKRILMAGAAALNPSVQTLGFRYGEGPVKRVVSKPGQDWPMLSILRRYIPTNRKYAKPWTAR